MRAMTTPLVECTAAVERLLTQQQQQAAQRKRTVEDETRLNSLIEAYNQLSKQKITRVETPAPAPGLVNASTTPRAPVQQQQQPAAGQSAFEEKLNARLAQLAQMNVQTVNLKAVHERAKRLREH
jgi:ribosomal protein S10